MSILGNPVGAVVPVEDIKNAKETASKSLPLAGGKMTGPIDMSGQSIANLPDPEEEGDAVPLGYLNADVLAKMLASGYMVLSDKQYGAAFPEDAPDGTVFLVEVQE